MGSNLKILFTTTIGLLLWSCGNISNINEGKQQKTDLSKDSLKDFDGLKKLLSQNIHPITFDCDTFILNDMGPRYTDDVSKAERAVVYIPFLEDSLMFFNALQASGRKIFFATSDPKFDTERALKIQIEGHIIANNQILIAENYDRFPCSGHIEKLFTHSNGKWAYFIKDSSWLCPIFDDTAHVKDRK